MQGEIPGISDLQPITIPHQQDCQNVAPLCPFRCERMGQGWKPRTGSFPHFGLEHPRVFDRSWLRCLHNAVSFPIHVSLFRGFLFLPQLLLRPLLLLLLCSSIMASSTTTAAAAAASNRATPQGGILEGGNPTHYDTKNPIVVFIIQAVIIIVLCRLIHWPLSKIRQPRVIAEVIGGIILGPSVMGHIPGFTEAIFPTASIPNLNVVANLGLILFLFLVGLETDIHFLVSNWRTAVSVSAAGMILPFGLGCAISYGLYHEFQEDPGTVPIEFGTYLLFIGIAMAITAFPVLCRILTELKLLGTRVGVITLSAGVGNDIVGWVLLALCVALVNAGTGLTALYVLLVCVGYMIFLIYGFRPVFLRFLRRTGSLQKGPSQSVVTLTLLIALASAFFTQVIGVHAIFGGFVIGLMCPHEGGFAIKLTEKIEDLVTALFLPLYFTLSGLSTDLGLLNSGIVWGYVVGVIVIAFTAKVTGGTLASRWTGLLWRESFSIGVLMSCKGLVELIVLVSFGITQEGERRRAKTNVHHRILVFRQRF